MDREKVIKETEDGIAFVESRGFGGLANAMRDALVLLKEQKAVKPEKAPFPDASRSDGSWYFICGVCSKPIDPYDKYCRECGKPILWEGR